VFAVIDDRSRQYGVRQGDTVACDLAGDWKPGDEVVFDRVLLLSHEGEVRVGKPCVAGATVRAQVVGEVKGEKLVVFRFKRRKNNRKKTGHRQRYAEVRITAIEA
jgi:large subunit ribosomal protein L21